MYPHMVLFIPEGSIAWWLQLQRSGFDGLDSPFLFLNFQIPHFSVYERIYSNVIFSGTKSNYVCKSLQDILCTFSLPCGTPSPVNQPRHGVKCSPQGPKCYLWCLTWPMCLWNCHVHHSPSILRFGGGCGEPANPRLWRRAWGQAVRVVISPCRELLRWCVWYEAFCNGELGMSQLLFHFCVLIRSR